MVRFGKTLYLKFGNWLKGSYRYCDTEIDDWKQIDDSEEPIIDWSETYFLSSILDSEGTSTDDTIFDVYHVKILSKKEYGRNDVKEASSEERLVKSCG